MGHGCGYIEGESDCGMCGKSNAIVGGITWMTADYEGSYSRPMIFVCPSQFHWSNIPIGDGGDQTYNELKIEQLEERVAELEETVRLQDDRDTGG